MAQRKAFYFSYVQLERSKSFSEIDLIPPHVTNFADAAYMEHDHLKSMRRRNIYFTDSSIHLWRFLPGNGLKMIRLVNDLRAVTYQGYALSAAGFSKPFVLGGLLAQLSKTHSSLSLNLVAVGFFVCQIGAKTS